MFISTPETKLEIPTGRVGGGEGGICIQYSIKLEIPGGIWGKVSQDFLHGQI